jgi:hypothetical protein
MEWVIWLKEVFFTNSSRNICLQNRPFKVQYKKSRINLMIGFRCFYVRTVKADTTA